VSETSAFLDSIADLDIAFTFDRHAARRGFRDALAHATPGDREFLDDLVETFTLFTYRAALERLAAKWGNDPGQQERMRWLVPTTDPGLYTRDRADRAALLEQRARRNGSTIDDEAFAEKAQLLTAESQRQSMRLWRNPPGRTYLAPSRKIDKSRLLPEQIRNRIQARGKHRPAEVEPGLVAEYVADNLYIDTTARELADARAAEERMFDNGLLAIPAPWKPRFQGDIRPIDADESRAAWACEFVGYVAEQHQCATALAGKRPVSEITALDRAERRTTLRGDRRPQMPVGGNGLDYDHEAMSPVSGWRCVSCWIERSVTDQRTIHIRDGRPRSDDGLCDYCRADDRPGLSELPAGFTAAHLARSYCGFLTDPDNWIPSGAACAVLIETRRRAPRWLIEIIDEFIGRPEDSNGTEQATPPTPGSDATPSARPRHNRRPILGAGQRQARCEGCTRIRAIHDDGFCTECRVWLGLVTPVPRQRTAA